MDEQCEAKVRKFALQSRLVVFAIQLLSNVLVPDHNPEDVFIPPPSSRGKENYIDTIISANLGGFQRWDGLYFMHIAEHGYIYENSLAFFPLFPWCVRILASYVLYPLHYVMTYRSVLMLAASFLNLILFVQAASLLYALGKKTLGDKGIAYKAALLFCVNPASIFMSAPYSETLFTFLIFWGLLKFEKKNLVFASVILGFSALTRSNGLLNAGFQLHSSCKNFLKGMHRLNSVKFADKEAVRTGLFSEIIIYSFPLIFMMLVFLMPFTLYHYVTYRLFCMSTPDTFNIPTSLKMYGRIKGYNIIGQTTPPWCNHTLPLFYNHVQHSHWGVGFLQYYEFKQIPNFILALPVTILAVSSIICYYKKNKTAFVTMGLSMEDVYKKTDSPPVSDYGFSNRKLLPYVFHVMFLLIFGWLYIHIQVLTRMLFSSSPLLYWYAAYIITKETPMPQVNAYNVMKRTNENITFESQENLSHPIKNQLLDQIFNITYQPFLYRLLLFYFCSYFIIGTIAFSNFFPWT